MITPENPTQLKYLQFQIGWVETNCYLLWEPASKQALIIDPGAPSEQLESCIIREKLLITAIVNTHGHADHIGGNYRIKTVTGAPLYIHEHDHDMLHNADLNLSAQWGFPIFSPPADDFAEDGRQYSLGRHHLEILHTPGHTPGSICILADDMLFSGDTIFEHSVGRTDLPRGNSMQLMASLKEKIMPLSPRTVILPGHGPKTTLEHEINYNPFLGDFNARTRISETEESDRF